MKHIISYTVNAAHPRLSDEEPDLLEQDDSQPEGSTHSQEGWLPWSAEDLMDIRKIIEHQMPRKEREIIEAYLAGLNNKSLGVTEKYWRYHFERGIKFIKKELEI